MNIKILEQSVKSLFLKAQFKGNCLASGTGFLAKSPIGHVLITNRHIVTGRNNDTDELLSLTGGFPTELVISHNKKNVLGEWVTCTEPLYNQNNQPLWHEHPTLGSKADVVALPLTYTNEVELRTYNLDEGSSIPYPKPSDRVSVVGFPFGRSTGGGMAIWVTGFVASEQELPEPKFLIDSRTRPGQSGSPVIAQHNNGCTYIADDGTTKMIMGTITQFIGIYSGRINRESDIGIVWKASILKELVNSLS